MAPDPLAFAELKACLAVLRAAAERRPSAIDEWLADDGDNLLPATGIAKVWPKLLGQCPNPARLLVESHRWFDALATIRFIRRRGERDTPPLPVEQAWRKLMTCAHPPGGECATTDTPLAQARRLQATDDCRGLLALPDSAGNPNTRGKTSVPTGF